MKSLTTLAILLTLFLGINSANAQNGELTYAEFLSSCQNPGAFGHQRPPQSIKIDCKNVYTGWEQIESGSFSLPESRQITSEIFSDKYHVSVADYSIETPDRRVTCPRLREVIQRVTVEKSITCEQILANPQSLETLCLQVIDEAVANNPALVVSSTTGRVYNVCSDEDQKP